MRPPALFSSMAAKRFNHSCWESLRVAVASLTVIALSCAAALPAASAAATRNAPARKAGRATVEKRILIDVLPVMRQSSGAARRCKATVLSRCAVSIRPAAGVLRRSTPTWQECGFGPGETHGARLTSPNNRKTIRITAIGNGRSCMPTTGRLAVLASVGLVSVGFASFGPVRAAEVTYERLLNAPNEPENWLMVHRDYNNSRHSPLSVINTTNAKDLKPKFIFSIGGMATGGSTLRGKEEATPLVDDGFMYVNDTWARVMKFDVRSGDGAVPLWRYDPKLKQSRRSEEHTS